VHIGLERTFVIQLTNLPIMSSAFFSGISTRLQWLVTNEVYVKTTKYKRLKKFMADTTNKYDILSFNDKLLEWVQVR
jgi:hypothetical protein